MLILKVLGGAALEGPDGPIGGRPAQKRRLALLALLAMSRTSRLSREKLISYLWPDRDEESARHLLSDAVYILNRALGTDTLVAMGDELRLNPGKLACDARTFEEAAPQDPEAAAQMYAGPFLDGFFLEGSEEFENWMTRERERLAGLFAAALERAAELREARGDHRGFLEAWRRLSAEDPYNSRVAIGLARALERSGDSVGALQAAQAHAAFLKKELGLQPPPELRDLVPSLQSVPDQTTGAPGRTPEPVPTPEPVLDPVLASDDGRAPVVTTAAQRPGRLSLVRPVWWAVAALAIVAGLLVWISPWSRASSADPSQIRSLAVMPFEAVGLDSGGRYIGEGVADDLTTRLGRETALKVAGRTSAFALQGRKLDAREIGRMLGVDALIEGSVRREGDRVRVAVRLVSARDGYQIWSQTWDRSLPELQAVHEQIAAAVARVLAGEPPARADERPAGAVPPDVYQLYVQGRYLWHQRTRDSLQRAAEAFEAAVRSAPAYGEAFSGLADAYAVMGFYDYLPPSEAFPRARVAAQRALTLDPRLAQAHASLGYVALYYDWNWTEAEAAFKRAIALNPSYSVGHQWYANYLTAAGRFDEAVAEMRRAQEVDPLSLIASAALGWVHFFQRDYEAAVAQCRRTLDLNPRFELAYLWAGWAHEMAGRHAEALDRLATAVRLSSNGAVALASLGRAHAMSGDHAAARRTLAQLHRDHRDYLPAYELAKVHLALGEGDEAIAWLRRARAERSHSIVFLRVDPQLDALRGDPRFLELETSIHSTSR